MATILAHITVRDGCEEQFEDVARTLWATTHRDETGVRRYEYWRAAAPRSYYTVLAFDDYRAFLAHQTSPHHEAASPDLGRLIEHIRLEWVDPVQGASDLPATASQPVPADADALTRAYASRFAADIAEWWDPRR